MKIAIQEDSDTRLKVRLTPIYLAVYLLVGVRCVVGAWFIIKVLAVTITISVNDGKLSYERAFLGKYENKSHSFAVGEIEKIEVKVPEDSGSYEIVVSAAGSSFTMPLVSEGGDGKERCPRARMLSHNRTQTSCHAHCRAICGVKLNTHQCWFAELII